MSTCCRAYWPCGNWIIGSRARDFLRGPDLHDNFIRYQSALLEEFRNLAEEHDFVTIDARRSVGDVFEALQAEVREALKGMGEA